MSDTQTILQIDTQVEIEKIVRQLDTLPNKLKAPSVLASAINATANEMKKKIGQRARKRYAISDKKILTKKDRGGMYLERATRILQHRHPDLQGVHGGSHGLHDQEEHRNHGGHAESPERKRHDRAGGGREESVSNHIQKRAHGHCSARRPQPLASKIPYGPGGPYAVRKEL